MNYANSSRRQDQGQATRHASRRAHCARTRLHEASARRVHSHSQRRFRVAAAIQCTYVCSVVSHLPFHHPRWWHSDSRSAHRPLPGPQHAKRHSIQLSLSSRRRDLRPLRQQPDSLDSRRSYAVVPVVTNRFVAQPESPRMTATPRDNSTDSQLPRRMRTILLLSTALITGCATQPTKYTGIVRRHSDGRPVAGIPVAATARPAPHVLFMFPRSDIRAGVTRSNADGTFSFVLSHPPAQTFVHRVGRSQAAPRQAFHLRSYLRRCYS